MSNLIIPDAQDVESMTNRDRKQFEREQKDKALAPFKQLRVKDLYEILPLLVPPIVDPAFSQLYSELMATRVTLVALKEIMLEKLDITEGEMDAKFDEILDRIQKETPNSPALAEAKEAAEDANKVQRLDEPGSVREGEQASRRLVEG